MDTLLLVVGGYLLVGVIAIGLLDILTGRVRNRLKSASVDTMALTGENRIVALIITALALWLLWPAAIYAAIKG